MEEMTAGAAGDIEQGLGIRLDPAHVVNDQLRFGSIVLVPVQTVIPGRRFCVHVGKFSASVLFRASSAVRRCAAVSVNGSFLVPEKFTGRSRGQ
jgi:hypothetical protein